MTPVTPSEVYVPSMRENLEGETSCDMNHYHEIQNREFNKTR